MGSRSTLLLAGILGAGLSLISATTQAVPQGFVKERVFAGKNVNGPQKVDFGGDGSIFIIGAGKLQYFKDINDQGRITFDVSNRDARHSLHGMAVHPGYPDVPFVYLLWNNAWGKNGNRLTRIEVNPADGRYVQDSETTLLDKWCVADWDAHAYGDIKFGPDGFLYLSWADGTRPQGTEDNGDWDDRGLAPGQSCNDPANEGGGYRTQDHLTPNDELLLNGTVLRLDPMTGEAAPGNWNIGKGVAEDDRVIAWGLRNPYRFTVAPWGEIFVSDVGWNEVEEINLIANPLGEPPNFGWPCYEGGDNMTAIINGNTYGAETNYYKDKNFCNANFYGKVDHTNPWYQWYHDQPNGPNSNPNCGDDGCNEWAVTGIDVAPFEFGGAEYENALFVADYSQSWIRVYLPEDGRPSKGNFVVFDDNAKRATYLGFSPTGELWYTDYANNHVYRIYNPNIDSNEIPVIAAFDASTLKGASPLSVTFDASGSSGEDMQVTWDLDGDGQFDDGNTLATQATYTTAGLHKVSLRVEDVNGQTDFKTIMLQVASADNGVDITIHQPDPGMHWAADDIVTLDGTAVLSGTDTPAANMAWDAGINHCDRTDPTDCHSHPLGSDIVDPFANTTSLLAPQHEMPTSIELSLCADGQPFAADWWNASWNKRRFIFVNNSQQNEGLTDFPALVKLDGSRIDYSVAGANGQSLRFVDAQGQLLAHEIESWDPNGESVVWVKINAISASTVNDYIVMYYDNPAASSAQNSGAVWSNNFAGVWHLNQLNDSTTNGNNGANNGSDSLQGAIGLGRHFNGTDEFIGIPHSNSLALANQLTVEAWIKADNPIDQMFGRFISKKSAFAGTDGFELQFHPATDYVSVIGSGNANLVKGEGAVDGETWNYISATINGANATLYVNGEAVSTGPIDPVVANNIPLNIGRAGADQNYFRGLIDEVRLSSSVRSAAWVAAQHLSMSDQLLQFSLEDTRAPVRFCKFIDEIHPQITTVRVRSNPAGLPALGLDSDAFDQDDITHEVIVNSPTSIFANPQLTNNGQLAQFRCWQEEILASGQVEEFDCNNDIPDIVPVTPLSFIADYNVSDIPESNFPSLSLRGTFNGWGTLPMTLVADNLWRVNATFTGAGDGNGGDRLKFDVLGDWVQNYGDNIPANGIADPVGDDIPVTEDGEYVIEFNDQTFAYSITPAITGPQPPVANAGADISVAPGTTVTFDGSGSNDPNGVISTYEWNSTAFPQTLTGQSPSFTFADVGVFTIVLTVTDNEGLDDNDTLVVTVEPQPLQSQFDTMFIRGTMNSANGCGGWGTTAMALVADFTWMVEFSFDGRCASHEMKFDASGLWTAGQNWGDDLADGIADLGGDNILLDPNHNDFRVTFNTQTRVYSVEAINLVAMPVVNAGADQNVTTDQQDIVLNGSATDADGTIVSTEWTQVSGPQSVFLTNSDQLSASYPTPMAGTYVFKLTAIDNDGNSGEDTITVTITEPGLQSQFDTMFIRGTMNSANGCGGWGTTAMALVADFTWMVEFSFDARCASHELKFDASGLWTAGQNWGDDLADGTADLGGDNIVLDPNHNDYRVTFNTQTLVYTVEALNQVAGPVVDAGDNVVATTDQQDIVLNGSASDADGTIVSIEWNQLSGPQSIFLTNSDQLSASYPTPMAGTYVFELTVTDNDGNSASDTVTVTVSEPTLQSTFDSMFIRGTMNSANGCGGWGTTAMALVEDFTWELEFSFDGRCASHELKFDASGLWTAGQNWGDNEGDGIADAGGDNIVLNPNHNTFLVRFNDQTKEYLIIER